MRSILNSLPIFFCSLNALAFSPTHDYPNWPEEGMYGSDSLYCGMDVFHSNQNTLIVTYVDNPAVPRHRCTARGMTELFYYNPADNSYKVESEDLYCLITFRNNSYSFRQSCYRKSDNLLQNSVVYQRFN